MSDYDSGDDETLLTAGIRAYLYEPEEWAKKKQRRETSALFELPGIAQENPIFQMFAQVCCRSDS